MDLVIYDPKYRKISLYLWDFIIIGSKKYTIRPQMETFGELKKWVESLTVAEKRFIKLLGKARAGASASQQLELFDWLNRSQITEATQAKVKFLKNLPTVSIRLKDLILDGLRLLHKESNIDALLRTTLDEIAILHVKKQDRMVIKQLVSAKKLALLNCRYAFAFQSIEWQQKIAQAASGTSHETLKKMREEESDILKKLCEQRDLQYRHDALIALMRQSLFQRDAKKSEEINALVEHEVVHRLSKSGGYLERTLAVNLLALKKLNERNASAALLLYRDLIREWQEHPAWQNDQSSLLLLICKLYQTAGFFSPVNWKDAREHMAMVHNFKGLPPDANRDFQRMLYHNQFTLALNNGKFDSVRTLIPEIDLWITQEAAHLTEAQILPFLCNFSIAEFLGENFAAANRFVSRILNMTNRNVRKDIREFAMVLQAILQFELNNTGLNEYLTRSGKRHFSKDVFEINFELVVFEYLNNVNHIDSPDAMRLSIHKLIGKLDILTEQAKDQIPVLGLNEVQMWAKAKQTGESLTEIFLQIVKTNLKELEQTEIV